jgi:hypothetical protein
MSIRFNRFLLTTACFIAMVVFGSCDRITNPDAERDSQIYVYQDTLTVILDSTATNVDAHAIANQYSLIIVWKKVRSRGISFNGAIDRSIVPTSITASHVATRILREFSDIVRDAYALRGGPGEPAPVSRLVVDE